MNLGHINYLNCLPLNYIINKALPRDIIVHAKVPAELNKAVVEEQLDVSPVSSIIYAQNYKKLNILPGVSITTDGMVESIILVSKVPIEELNGEKVLLTAQSATSHCLLKIIAQKKYHVLPHYEIADISPGDDYLKEAKGALFIGDNALYINNHRQAGLYYYDLGYEWKDYTSLPMVYALWVTSKDKSATHIEKVQKLHEFVLQGFKKGFAQLKEAIRTSEKVNIFSPEILWNYLHVIKWNLDGEEIKGLKLFYEYAYELNLIEEVPALAFFGEE